MPKISIIVPVYNVEQYLDRSIKSLINQTLQDIEIILVNDGSKDNSLAICKQYAALDTRIRVIDKPNGGVSSARNEGVRNAIGKYIGFIDPDDWIEQDMYEQLYKKITIDNCDVVACNYVVDDNITMKEIHIPVKKTLLTKEDITQWLIPNMIGPKDLNSNGDTIMGSVWRLLVKRELIVTKDIRFPVSIPLMEDLIWCIEVFLNTKSLSIHKGCYYHYMKNEESAVTRYRPDLSEIQVEVLQKIKQLLEQHDVLQYAETRLELRHINIIMSNIINEVHKDCPKTMRQKIQSIKTWCQEPYIKEIINKVSTKHYTIRKRMVLNAMKKEFAGYLYVYYEVLKRI